MNKFLLFAFLIAVNAFAQPKLFRFIEKETGKPVMDADVYTDSVFVGTTNYNGNVKIDLSGSYSTAIVKHIAFEKRVIPKDSLAVQQVYFMKKHDYMLDEVFVDSRTDKDTMVGHSVNFSWGDRVATYIPGEKDGTITTLRFAVKTLGGVKGLNFLPFKANLYQYDTKTKLPGKPLLKEDILVTNPNGDYWAEIDISKLNIATPPEGIFVAFVIPEWEEGIYKTQFIQAKFGTISAVPALHRRLSSKDHFSCLYTRGDNPRWEVVRHICYKMELRVVKD